MIIKKNLNNSNKLGNIPRWNLKDFYENPESKKIIRDLENIKKSSLNFEKKYEGKIKNLNSKKLYKAIAEFEEINKKMSKIISYAHLLFVENLNNEKNKIFFQKIQEKITNYSSSIVFFNLELNLISNYNLTKLFKNKKLLKYKNWLLILRSYRPYQLDKDLEKLMRDKNITSSLSWSRLFDETIASLKFPFRGKELSATQIFNYMTDKDPKKRKQTAKSIGLTLERNINIFTIISNTLAKDKNINDRWRKFPNSISNRNLSNVVEDEVVENLSFTVQSYYPKLSHRYYNLKAKWFKKKKLMYWDRNAPLPFQINRSYSWNQARDIVIEAYGSFNSEIEKIVRLFFDKSWIDAEVRQGKQSGAFSASTVPDLHPFILLNYQGKIRDISTLAHELGHGVHQFLAAEQGYFNSSTPLTLAETASVFGEMLTFKHMLLKEKNLINRKALLANKVEDMLNTVVRQIAFFEFEKQLHNKRKEVELSTEEICKIWIKVQSESLGPYINFEKEYKYYWAYIPHFIHSPFYVYAYAFGDCLVNTLYSVYEKNPNGFDDKYINLLRSGGSKKYRELLKPFNLNPSNNDFWKKGLNIISNLIDELEEIENN
tara:strand:+ start:14630 stop:16432 length:1803 start_codon:yes stop_codon:yes gene_type:complete